MKYKEAFRYGIKILCRKGTWLLAFFFVWSVCLFGRGAFLAYTLHKDMAKEVQLRCNIPGEDSGVMEEIQKSDNIKYAARLFESSRTLIYHGYYTEVELVGIEREIFEDFFRNDIVVSGSEMMPSVILGASVAENLKNDKEEPIEEVTSMNLLCENVVLDGINTRVCGVSDTAFLKENEDVRYAYVTLEDYKRIAGSEDGAEDNVSDDSDFEEESEAGDFDEEISEAYDSDAGGQDMDTQDENTSEDKDVREDSACCLVSVDAGINMEETLDAFEELGISLQSEEYEQLLISWKDRRKNCIEYVVAALLLFICSFLLTYYQDRIWIYEHRDFVDYIGTFAGGQKTLRRIFRFRSCSLIAGCIIVSALIMVYICYL